MSFSNFQNQSAENKQENKIQNNEESKNGDVQEKELSHQQEDIDQNKQQDLQINHSVEENNDETEETAIKKEQTQQIESEKDHSEKQIQKHASEKNHSEKQIQKNKSQESQAKEETKPKQYNSREEYEADLRKYKSLKRKLLFLKVLIIISGVLTVFLTFYVIVYCIIMYDNSEYIDKLNSLLKKETISEKIGDETNRLIIIDFGNDKSLCTTNKTRATGLIRSNTNHSNVNSKKIIGFDGIEGAIEKFERDVQNDSDAICNLDKLNEKRDRLITESAGFFTKIGMFVLRDESVRKSSDDLFKRIFIPQNKGSFKYLKYIFFDCNGLRVTTTRIYDDNTRITGDVFSFMAEVRGRNFLSIMFSQMSSNLP